MQGRRKYFSFTAASFINAIEEGLWWRGGLSHSPTASQMVIFLKTNILCLANRTWEAILMPRSCYDKWRFAINDVCEIVKTLSGMSDFDCELSGTSGRGFVGISVVRVIEGTNRVLWVVVTKGRDVAYQMKSLKWLSTYYELIEDADEFFVAWNNRNRITKYYLIERTD